MIKLLTLQGNIIKPDNWKEMVKAKLNNESIPNPTYKSDFIKGKNIGGGTMENRNTPYQRGDKTPPAYYIWTLEQKNEFQIFSMNWASECLRVLKPGGYLLSFGGTRTYHRMACGIEDAGFEIRDTIMWVYGCVPEETQILTKKGWMNYTSLKKGEHIFSFNPLDNRIDSDEVQEIYEYGYKGEMVKLKNDNTEQLLTPNHRVYLKEGFRKQNNYERRCYLPENWSWKYAEQIKNYGQYILPLGAIYEGYLSVGTDFAELLGWILSEGNFQGNAINIYQSDVNLNKVLIIKNILDRLKIKYSHYQRKKKYKERYYTEHQFYFSGDIVDRIKEWIPNKKPTYELLNLKYNEKIALFNSLMLGDGSKKNGEEYITFYQNDLNFLEWFQTLCHLIGKQARINKNKMCVEVHHNPNTQLQSKHLKKRKSMYSGIVWCPKTKNGTWIARYKGRIFITGNSGFPKSLNIGKQIDKMDTEDFRKEIGQIIKEARNKKGYTMDKLCELLNLNNEGHGGMVNHYENGRATPTIELWNQLCELLEITKENYDKEKNGRLEIIGKKITNLTVMQKIGEKNISGEVDIKIPTTQEAKEWESWGTALKPAVEPIVVARKPLSEKNVALNVLKWGTGGINIDECRIPTNEVLSIGSNNHSQASVFQHNQILNSKQNEFGRFPANIILDEEAGKLLGEPSRFFYCPKASKSERNFGCEEFEDKQKCPMSKESRIGECINASKGMERFETICKNNHPTVKPIKLMEYLIKLVSKENAVILDPFLGSGTTAIACLKTNRKFIGIEKESDYVKIAEARIKPYLEQQKL